MIFSRYSPELDSGARIDGHRSLFDIFISFRKLHIIFLKKFGDVIPGQCHNISGSVE